MSSSSMFEIATNLVTTQIQTNIAAALVQINIDRTGVKPIVSLEPPRSYFVYPKIKGYDAPAVFTLCDYMDFRKEQMGANFVDAIIRMNVAILIESSTEESLTVKAWRYQAALHKVLDQVGLTSSADNVKLFVVVKRATLSGVDERQEGASQKMFRKEVNLECDLYHFENF